LREKQAVAVERFFLFLAQLAGYPAPEYYFKELGRVYTCSNEGASAVAVYPNELIPALRGREVDVLYVSSHLTRSLRYVASLIDRAAETNPDCIGKALDLLRLRDVRNINGLPYVVPREGRPLRISDVASGVAHTVVLALATCVADRVFIDEPEAHLHPGLVKTLGRLLDEMIKERKIKVVAATQSIEVIDAFTHIDVEGSVVRLKNCRIHDQIQLQEARDRIDSLYDDLRYY